MINKYADRFIEKRAELEQIFAAKPPGSYEEIVEEVVRLVTTDDYGDMDPSRIHKIDDGDYQGTLVFVIGANGYQPSTYWYTKVSYGSCSGCDTLEAIRDYSDEPPTPEKVKEYWTLALHIVQHLKQMGEDD